MDKEPENLTIGHFVSPKHKGSNTTENKNAIINEARGKYTTFYNKNKSKPKYLDEFS